MFFNVYPSPSPAFNNSTKRSNFTITPAPAKRFGFFFFSLPPPALQLQGFSSEPM